MHPGRRPPRPAQPAGWQRPGPPAGPPGPSLLDPGQARWPADYRLSVDRRPTAVLPLPGRLVRIGRTPDNDLVLSDLSVSRQHAELRKSSSGNYEIADLGSHNGTIVNGQRVTSATLSEKDIASVGHATFRLTAGELREYIDAGDVSLVAQLMQRLGRVSRMVPRRWLRPAGRGAAPWRARVRRTVPAGTRVNR